MLCLSGFELYSRWVPLNYPNNDFEFVSNQCLDSYIYTDLLVRY